VRLKSLATNNRGTCVRSQNAERPPPRHPPDPDHKATVAQDFRAGGGRQRRLRRLAEALKHGITERLVQQHRQQRQEAIGADGPGEGQRPAGIGELGRQQRQGHRQHKHHQQRKLRPSASRGATVLVPRRAKLRCLPSSRDAH
jgi:hypothetical protein